LHCIAPHSHPSLNLTPQTGSAHAVLTEYYFKGPGRARIGDATTLDAYQVSARGGHLTCEIVDGKAKIVGRAWLTASGVLEL
jgi:predicted PhzF superfamily epimerase YddE/YHI9